MVYHQIRNTANTHYKPHLHAVHRFWLHCSEQLQKLFGFFRMRLRSAACHRSTKSPLLSARNQKHSSVEQTRQVKETITSYVALSVFVFAPFVVFRFLPKSLSGKAEGRRVTRGSQRSVLGAWSREKRLRFFNLGAICCVLSI